MIFTGGAEHTRAAEILIHFLLCKIDLKRARKDFAICYPVCEPRQSREFRTTAFKWMESLKNDTSSRKLWPKWSQVRRSYFDECMGIRFETMMWGLAVSAICKCLLVNNQDRNASYYLENDKLENYISVIVNETVPALNTITSEKNSASKTLKEMTLEKNKIIQSYVIATEDRMNAINIFKNEVIKKEMSISKINVHCKSINQQIELELAKLSAKKITFSRDLTLKDIKSEFNLSKTQIRELLFLPVLWIEEQQSSIEAINQTLGYSNKDKLLKLNGETSASLVLLQKNDNGYWSEWLYKNSLSPYTVDPSDQKLKLDLSVFFKMGTQCLKVLNSDQINEDTFSSKDNSLDYKKVETPATPSQDCQNKTDNEACKNYATISKPSNIDLALEKVNSGVTRAEKRIEILQNLKNKLMGIAERNSMILLEPNEKSVNSAVSTQRKVKTSQEKHVPKIFKLNLESNLQVDDIWEQKMLDKLNST
ncbi:hypothetical protein BB559_000509 [Furculomyces boomerangus]|uniref:HAUS augmin-like complex subunit 6 N-terminal domain-containing protein n=1 Tax=Furculomyces boomerangus TaxID=61424 RepID=A0A2T9Z531_9FUNG|nr:hypothetical protein BB559_000509 [Furculomyces boomerangus]